MIDALVIFGSLVNLGGALWYARDIFSGRSKPNRMSFLLWALAPLIAAAASFSAGVTWPVLSVLMSGITPPTYLTGFFSTEKSLLAAHNF